jgi:hypothetical protein
MFWRINLLLGKDHEINEISDSFLSNGSVNTHNSAVTVETGVFSTWAILRR